MLFAFFFSSFQYIPNLFFFFFNDTATTEIYTLSLHDALPISAGLSPLIRETAIHNSAWRRGFLLDRKSTRLNSSHGYISYAVFCLKKKKNIDATCVTVIYSQQTHDHPVLRRQIYTFSSYESSV